MLNIFGVSLSIILAVVSLISVLGFFKFGKGIQETMFGWIPFGNPKLWTILIVVITLAVGGFTALAGSLSLGTGSIITGEQIQTAMPGSISCQFVSAPTGINASGAAAPTARADPNDLSHYYVDVVYDSGADSINGSLYCKDDRADISKGVQHECYVKADAYRSQTSTTDSNTYYILATSSSKSQVPGFPWAQTAYLSDSDSSATGATTNSNKEKTDLVFAQDEAAQYLGYYMTLPGTTAFGYLNNQTSNDVEIICDGSEVATLTITKVTA